MKQLIISNSGVDNKNSDNLYFEEFFCYMSDDYLSGNYDDYKILKLRYSSSDCKRFYDYVYELTVRLLTQCKDRLNEYNGILFSERQYFTSYGWIVLRTVFNAYIKYLKFKQIEDNSYCVSDVIPSSPANLTWESYSDDSYNTYVCMELSRFFGFCTRVLGETTDLPGAGCNKNTLADCLSTRLHRLVQIISPTCNPADKNSIIKKRDTEKICRGKGKRSCCNSLVFSIFYETEFEYSIISNSKKGDVIFLDRLYLRDMASRIKNEVAAIDSDARKRIFEHFCPQNEFEEFLKGFLPKVFPVECLEAFKEYCIIAGNIKKSISCRKIYVASPEDIIANTFIAISKDVDVYEVLHSGAYVNCDNMSYFERMVYPNVITFYLTGKSQPLYNAREKRVAPIRYNLKKKGEIINRSKLRILYATPCYCRYADGFNYFCYGYYSNQKRFFDVLSNDLICNTVIHVPSYDLDYERMFARRWKGLTIENNQLYGYSRSLMNSDLVVCTEFSSTFYEALVSGVPTVIFENTPFDIENECASGWKELLKGAHIYYESPEQCAEWLNNHKESFAETLHSDSNRIIIEQYLNETVCDEKNAFDKWHRELSD